ncbi:unnamed protein product [Dibothriocephalus latus]|uniref:Uncharacterized protein n=1 Tax=Dibothriocephalus latus TaxID=60516 RepID=A0A3P7NZ88_DIBLA|nr:unnamed protein product [Dibothriocephalus latus]
MSLVRALGAAMSGIGYGRLMMTTQPELTISVALLLCGAFLGLTVPFIIPQVVRYARMDHRGILLDSDPLSPRESDIEDQTLSSFSEFERTTDSKGPTTRARACKRWFRRQARDILQFYQAPVTRFLYNTIFYVIFLLIFSNIMLRSLTITCSPQEMVVVLMVLSLLVEELKQVSKHR